jgi:hypothetical protein
MRDKKLDEFRKSVLEKLPPDGMSIYTQSLWWAEKGNWDKAHELIQDLNDQAAARIHAYLHRLEGDISNAQYWYAKAGDRMPATDLNREWEDLVARFA